jgi:uridine kinase
MKGRTIDRYGDLADRILNESSCGPRLIAVDGPGGAGKSVFASRLSAALGDAPVIHTDDFATEEMEAEWWPRLEEQALLPLREGGMARFQAYDWTRHALGGWHEVRPGNAVILEGVSSARRSIADRLALAVWIHTPRELRLARGLARDGEASRSTWKQWMAEEDAHFRSDATVSRVDVFVDGAPAIPHDPEREFVRLAVCRYEWRRNLCDGAR